MGLFSPYSILILLKTSENFWFCDIFMGIIGKKKKVKMYHPTYRYGRREWKITSAPGFNV